MSACGIELQWIEQRLNFRGLRLRPDQLFLSHAGPKRETSKRTPPCKEAKYLSSMGIDFVFHRDGSVLGLKPNKFVAIRIGC